MEWAPPCGLDLCWGGGGLLFLWEPPGTRQEVAGKGFNASLQQAAGPEPGLCRLAGGGFAPEKGGGHRSPPPLAAPSWLTLRAPLQQLPASFCRRERPTRPFFSPHDLPGAGGLLVGCLAAARPLPSYLLLPGELQSAWQGAQGPRLPWCSCQGGGCQDEGKAAPVRSVPPLPPATSELVPLNMEVPLDHHAP